MASDFRSLLSNFQAATGDQEERNQTKNDGEKESLLQLTTKLWQVTQLRQCTKKTSPEPDRKPATADQKINIAVCLCVVDALPHEEIWRYWMDTAEKDDGISAELYIHAKHPERIASPWAKSKLIPTSYRPNWNDVRIIRAMLKLAETALEQETTTHVLFGTESCIPICTLQQGKSEISLNTSYAKCFGYRESTRFDEHNIWNVLQSSVPRDAIYKALPGWCCLCRSHMQAVLDLPLKHLQNQPLWPAFERVWAPEEVYFPTCLALLGLLEETDTERSLTFCKWDHQARNHKDRAHPKFFDADFDSNLVQSLRRRERCLFLRKVKDPMPLHLWQEAVGHGLDGKTSTREYHAGDKRKAYNDHRGSARYDDRHPQSHHRHRHDHGYYSRRRR